MKEKWGTGNGKRETETAEQKTEDPEEDGGDGDGGVVEETEELQKKLRGFRVRVELLTGSAFSAGFGVACASGSGDLAVNVDLREISSPFP